MTPQEFSPEEYPQPQETGPAFDINRLIQTAKKFYWLPIVGLAGGLVLALISVKRAVPIYSSTAEIKVERRAPTQAISLGGNGAAQEGATTLEDLKTIEHSFLNPMLMRRVIARMNLLHRDNFIGRGVAAKDVNEGMLVGFLMAHSSIKLVPDTRLLDISFSHWDPAVAQEVANALVEQGIDYDRDQRIAAVSANVRYLEEEAKKLELNLRESESKLNEYTRKLGSVSIDQELNIVADQLRELNSQYIAAKSRRLQLEADYEQIQKFPDDAEQLLAVESIRSVPAIMTLQETVSNLRGEIAKTAPRYPPGNPIMRQLRAQLAESQSALEREALRSQSTLKVALGGAKANEESLAKAREEQEQKVIQVKEESIQSQVLQRQIDADRYAYEAALKRLTEELSQARSQPVLLQIVDPAGGAWKVSPNPPKIFMTFITGGLMLGAGLIVLIMQLDMSVKSVEEAERALHLPSLAAVPKYEWTERIEGDFLPSDQSGPRWLDVPTLEDQHSIEAEAFRTLRTRLETGRIKEKAELILITSAVPREGKSFCAMNLAVAFAQGGRRTLLVDAQLRKPVLEERMFFSRGHRGLSDFLLGTQTFSSAIRTSRVPNLDVVTAGTPVMHPSELLSRQQRLSEFLGDAEHLYDVVIFDSTALSGISDTLSFARNFGLVCLVLRASKTSKPVAKRAVELLRRIGVKPAGLVVNYAPRPFAGTGGGYFPADEDEEEPDLANTLDFPKTCPSCGRIYRTFDEYLEHTTPPTDAETGQGDAAGDAAMRLFRVCQCGAQVIVASANRRDATSIGQVRRGVFGELLERLVESGMAREQARAKLLLILKVWQHEIYTDARDDGSEAGVRRREIFGELLDRLVDAGFPREEARDRLLKTIDIWRNGT